MTISLSLATVADSISKLSISGVTVKDLDELSASWKSLPNVLYPKPDGWISNAKFTVDTFGSMGVEKATFTCNMAYRFLGTEIGNMGAFSAAYSNVITKLVLILNVILANDVITGAVDFRLLGISNIGPLADPAGNVFHGCDLVFTYSEFVN
jgi:hypothetical protein